MPRLERCGRPSPFADIGSTCRQARPRTPGKVNVMLYVRRALDSWSCSTGGSIVNSSLSPIQRGSARTMQPLLSKRRGRRDFQQEPSFSSTRKKADECLPSSERMCTPGSMASIAPDIEPGFIAPAFLPEKQAGQPLLPRTIYKKTLAEGRSSSSFTTIRALHPLVVPSQGICRHRNTAVSHLHRSGNSPSHLEDGKSQPVARPTMTLMATATRSPSNEPMASMSMSIPLLHLIHLPTDLCQLLVSRITGNLGTPAQIDGIADTHAKKGPPPGMCHAKAAASCSHDEKFLKWA